MGRTQYYCIAYYNVFGVGMAIAMDMVVVMGTVTVMGTLRAMVMVYACRL